MRRLPAVVLAALMPFTLDAAPRDVSPVYAVVRIGSRIGDDEIVGSKRAGLACLGNGSIRWKTVATGDSMDRREIVQDVLEDEGLAVTPLGETVVEMRGHPLLRLRGEVTTAGFSLCAKRWALGDGQALSGDAKLAVEWRIEDRTTGAVEQRHLSQISRHLSGRQAMPLSSIYRALLTDAARDAAAWLRSTPAALPNAASVQEVMSRSTR